MEDLDIWGNMSDDILDDVEDSEDGKRVEAFIESLCKSDYLEDFKEQIESLKSDAIKYIEQYEECQETISAQFLRLWCLNHREFVEDSIENEIGCRVTPLKEDIVSMDKICETLLPKLLKCYIEEFRAFEENDEDDQTIEEKRVSLFMDSNFDLDDAGDDMILGDKNFMDHFENFQKYWVEYINDNGGQEQESVNDNAIVFLATWCETHEDKLKELINDVMNESD
jgi:hypothetical protein